MVRYAWIVFGAVACGTAIAASVGGSSTWGMALVLFTLAAAVAASAVAQSRRPTHGPMVDRVRLERQRLEQERFDHDLLARVLEVVGERAIDWLRHEDFDGAWRDNQISPLRDLEHLEAIENAPFAGDLGDALIELIDAIQRFLEYYELNTRPDSLLTGTDWREIVPLPAAKEATFDRARPSVDIPRDLVELAATVARAYDFLSELDGGDPRQGRRRSR